MKKNSKELALHYKKLLQSGHNSDVIIRFGQGENLKDLYAHSLILKERATFFNIALSSRWARRENNFFIIEIKDDVSINTFKTVLSYIYTTEISLDELSGIEILELLVEIDKLLLNEGISGKLNSYVYENLEKIIRKKDINTWESDDYIPFKNAINEFIPLIRWFQISNKEFKQNRQLLKNVLPDDLFNSILTYHLDPSSLLTNTRFLEPRYASNYVSSEPTIRCESFFSSYEDLVNINETLFTTNDHDIIIRVSNDIGFKDFYAHSLILCARSSYFKTAFSNINQDEKPFIFPIQDISTVVFEVIFRYLYTTEFDPIKLNGANTLMLIVAANKMDLDVIINYLLLPTNFAESTLRKLNGGDVLKLLMINELKIQNAINNILSENDIARAILEKLNGAQVLEIIEKTEELQIQKAIANKLSNKDFINNILYKFNAHDILKFTKISNDTKYRKTIDDLLTSADFIQIILYKLNIGQFLQFMKAATELQNNLIVINLFLNENFKLIVKTFNGAEIFRILIEANVLKLQNLFSDMTTYIDQNLENLLQDDAVG
ncbi:25073_t:CDS:2, partial [Racocetra persica]